MKISLIPTYGVRSTRTESVRPVRIIIPALSCLYVKNSCAIKDASTLARHDWTRLTQYAALLEVRLIYVLVATTIRFRCDSDRLPFDAIRLWFEVECQSNRSSNILVLKFILVLVFISFIGNHFYFYIITVLSDTIISVFISFASNHFYIYFIIVFVNYNHFACMSFYATNIKPKITWFCLICTVYQANRLTNSATDCHSTVQPM